MTVLEGQHFIQLNYTSMNHCLFCKAETENPKYCSRSCAAKHTNVLFPKRKPSGNCRTCNKPISSNKNYCSKSCKPLSLVDHRLEDIIYKEHHKSSAFALVRENARRVGRKIGFIKCINCGYDKHFEVCHIKAISSFPLDTLVSEINNSKNLIPLCPNCHWEYDNGTLIVHPVEFESTLEL